MNGEICWSQVWSHRHLQPLQTPFHPAHSQETCIKSIWWSRRCANNNSNVSDCRILCSRWWSHWHYEDIFGALMNVSYQWRSNWISISLSDVGVIVNADVMEIMQSCGERLIKLIAINKISIYAVHCIYTALTYNFLTQICVVKAFTERHVHMLFYKQRTITCCTCCPTAVHHRTRLLHAHWIASGTCFFTNESWCSLDRADADSVW